MADAAAEQMPTWTKVYDSSSQAYYFYNNYTGESVWDQPFDYEEPPSGSAAAALMNPELRAAMVIQRTYRKKQARRVLRAKKAANYVSEHAHDETQDHAGSGFDNGPWSKVPDTSSGYDYYYNNDTGECVWDPPPGTEWAAGAQGGGGDQQQQDWGDWGDQETKGGGGGGGGFSNVGQSGKVLAGSGKVKGWTVHAEQKDEEAKKAGKKAGDDDEDDEEGGKKEPKGPGCLAQLKAQCCTPPFDNWPGLWAYHGRRRRLPNKGAAEFGTSKMRIPPWSKEARVRDCVYCPSLDELWKLRGLGPHWYSPFPKDMEVCLCALLCPCLQHAVNERDIDKRNDEGFLCCLGYIFLSPCCCLLNAWSRGKTREIVGLPRGSILKRACIHLFCHPCALAQEEEEGAQKMVAVLLLACLLVSASAAPMDVVKGGSVVGKLHMHHDPAPMDVVKDGKTVGKLHLHEAPEGMLAPVPPPGIDAVGSALSPPPPPPPPPPSSSTLADAPTQLAAIGGNPSPFTKITARPGGPRPQPSDKNMEYAGVGVSGAGESGAASAATATAAVPAAKPAKLETKAAIAKDDAAAWAGTTKTVVDGPATELQKMEARVKAMEAASDADDKRQLARLTGEEDAAAALETNTAKRIESMQAANVAAIKQARSRDVQLDAVAGFEDMQWMSRKADNDTAAAAMAAEIALTKGAELTKVAHSYDLMDVTRDVDADTKAAAAAMAAAPATLPGATAPPSLDHLTGGGHPAASPGAHVSLAVRVKGCKLGRKAVDGQSRLVGMTMNEDDDPASAAAVFATLRGLSRAQQAILTTLAQQTKALCSAKPSKAAAVAPAADAAAAAGAAAEARSQVQQEEERQGGKNATSAAAAMVAPPAMPPAMPPMPPPATVGKPSTASTKHPLTAIKELRLQRSCALRGEGCAELKGLQPVADEAVAGELQVLQGLRDKAALRDPKDVAHTVQRRVDGETMESTEAAFCRACMLRADAAACEKCTSKGRSIALDDLPKRDREERRLRFVHEVKEKQDQLLRDFKAAQATAGPGGVASASAAGVLPPEGGEETGAGPEGASAEGRSGPSGPGARR
eukprot:g2382.t1